MTLKLGFADTVSAIENFFINLLKEKYDVVVDNENPDYLIFGDRNFGQNNLRYDPNKCIKIFYTGENQRPKDYQCHFSISFDHDEYDGSNYRLPLYVIYDNDNVHRKVTNLANYTKDQSDLDKKQGFCSFVVQNPNGIRRNDVFMKLNSWKKIASAGPWLNNMGFVLPRDETSVQTKLEFLSKYKFNLCFENSSYPGYVTEKIYEAFMAKTIPIYYGSPTVALDFNTKAFVNWHDYQNPQNFFDRIIELETQPEKYLEMFTQPIFANNELPSVWNRNRFLEWFDYNVYRGKLK